MANKIISGIDDTSGQYRAVAASDAVTFTDGAAVTNTSYLLYQLSSNQSVTNNTLEEVSWGTQQLNTDSWTTTTVGTGTGLVVPSALAGTNLKVTVSLWWDDSSGNNRLAEITHWDSTVTTIKNRYVHNQLAPAGSPINVGVQFTTILVSPVASDVIVVRAFQDTGAALNLLTADTAGSATYILIESL